MTNRSPLVLASGQLNELLTSDTLVMGAFQGSAGTLSGQVIFTGGAASGIVSNLGAGVSVQGYSPTNYQTGTTYTLALTDSGGRVSLANASAITLTVPASGTIAFAAETEIYIRQGGAGQVTISPAGGVTINSYLSANKIAGQYAYAVLKLSSTANTWDLFGNITP